MRRIRRLTAVSFTLILLGTLAGCGKPPMVGVKGVVTFNGKPLQGCKVSFAPAGTDFNPDRHGYGFGLTDAAGAYEVQHPEGTKGIFPGTYKVTFVAWVDSKGGPVPPEAKPSEYPGGVKNLLPSKYESLADTPETVTVPAGGMEKNFDLAN
ncbi:MAG: hypothetical protein ACRC33_07655 [Gemmataceae bacterium]